MFSQVMIVKVNDRKKSAISIQKVLTKYGCGIETRVGLHESTKMCANAGIIILQLTGTKKENTLLKIHLSKISGVKAKILDTSKF
ncbi:MAG: hypothetical protein V1672_04640 [Candidatus Diapherotrites archaeon]